MFIRFTSVNIQSSTWLPVTGLLVRMTMLFNWRWDDVQTLPAWWTVTRTIIYATLNQRMFYLKNLWMQALRIGQYSKRSVRKSSSKYFANSPLLFFTRNNYDTLLANVVSKARKFVLWTDFWLWIWNGEVPAVLFQIHPCSKCSVPTPRCSFEFMRVKMLPLHLLPEAIFRIHPCSNPPSLLWETVTQC